MNFRRYLVPFFAICLAVPVTARAQEAKRAPGTVNINTASTEQIALLPRVGAKVALRVVDYRKANGSFKRLEDLMEVHGIGEKLFLALKPYLTLSGTTTLASKISSAGSRTRKAGASPSAAAKKP